MKKGQKSSKGGYENVLCPFTYMYVTQGANGKYSHQGSQAVDVMGKKAGVRYPYYAPCKVKCVNVDSSIFTVFEEELGRTLSPMEYEVINGWFEKGISEDVIFEGMEQALITAYKKNFGSNQDVKVEMNKETGEFHVWAIRTVVDKEELADNEISLEDAQVIDDVVEIEVTPKNFGRIAAQNAKQIVVQRIREAEHGMVFERYQSRDWE